MFIVFLKHCHFKLHTEPLPFECFKVLIPHQEINEFRINNVVIKSKQQSEPPQKRKLKRH